MSLPLTFSFRRRTKVPVAQGPILPPRAETVKTSEQAKRELLGPTDTIIKDDSTEETKDEEVEEKQNVEEEVKSDQHQTENVAPPEVPVLKKTGSVSVFEDEQTERRKFTSQRISQTQFGKPLLVLPKHSHSKQKN
jgi:hypothetical protein